MQCSAVQCSAVQCSACHGLRRPGTPCDWESIRSRFRPPGVPSVLTSCHHDVLSSSRGWHMAHIGCSLSRLSIDRSISWPGLVPGRPGRPSGSRDHSGASDNRPTLPGRLTHHKPIFYLPSQKGQNSYGRSLPERGPGRGLTAVQRRVGNDLNWLIAAINEGWVIKPG